MSEHMSAQLLRANSPLVLTPDTTWLVARGQVDIFAAPFEQDTVVGRRVYLGTVASGSLLLGSSGFAQSDRTWQLLAVGVDALVEPLPQDWWELVPTRADYQRGLESWLAAMGSPYPVSGPRTLLSTSTDPQPVPAGHILVTATDMLWYQSTLGSVTVRGLPVPVDVAVPISPGSIFISSGPGEGTCLPTAALPGAHIKRSLDWLQALILPNAALRAGRLTDLAVSRDVRRAQVESTARNVALSELESIEFAEQIDGRGADPLLVACQYLGQLSQLTIKASPGWSSTRTEDPVRAIARASGVRVRAISLDDGWWRTGLGPMLAFAQEDGAPVVLRPRRRRGYDIVNLAAGTTVTASAAEAAKLRPSGYVYYPNLGDGEITVTQLLKFGLRGSGRDIIRAVWLSLLVGLLAMAIPVANGIILGKLVPTGSTSVIYAAAIALFLVVFASTSFLLSRSAALLRLQGRMLSVMQAGLWDRLLGLPAEFYTRYSVADLTLRATGVSAIQQIVSGVASQILLSLVTLVFSLVLLFLYSPAVAAWMLLITVITVVIASFFTVAQIRRLRVMYDAKGESSGVLLELIQGIDKIRASAAENRALAAWSKLFATQARMLLESQRFEAARTAIYAAMPVVLTLILFSMVGADSTIMSTAVFLTFVSALGQLTASTTSLDLNFGYVLNIVPLFDRVKPILDTKPEVAPGAADPGVLSGQVALTKVTFRYPGMSTPVLHDVDLQVRNGEFVALVGPSGSGKSTIVRLLLGFERPEAGAITYNNLDLTTLDVRSVRAQIGVALQDADVTGSDILSAIIGDWPLTMDDAWRAAEAVGLADDIRALPMGMRTLLGDNASTFSGGQRQRLILAAAIARNPRIVILDEATSALDSVTQAHVADSFQRLQVTRIVVAHRLSTIRKADRIVMLEGGRITAQGSYEELVQASPTFASMVRRQSMSILD